MMKKLSKKLKLNKRSIQILDDKALTELKGGHVTDGGQKTSCANRDSCSRVTTITELQNFKQ